MMASTIDSSYSSVINYSDTVFVTYCVGYKKLFIPCRIVDAVNNSGKSQSYSQLEYTGEYTKNYQMMAIRLNEFELLKFNWNGNKVKPFKKYVIHNAKRFLECIKANSQYISVFPTARQSIQFEYEIEGKYCEAEIFIDRVEIYAVVGEVENDVVFSEDTYIEKSAIEFLRILHGYR